MKKICVTCGRIMKFSDKCTFCSDKIRQDYNKQKTVYYKNNKETHKLLLTKKWSDFSITIKQRDNNLCQRCLNKYGVVNTAKLEVNHILPRTTNPELCFEPSNCVTVCSTCNKQLGTSGILDFEYKKNEEEIEFNL